MQALSHLVTRLRGYAGTVVVLLLLASVALNVFLARRVRSLQQFQVARALERVVKVGTPVPSLEVKSLSGEHQMISYQSTEQPTVLYIFTPTYMWCARNIDNLKTLLDKEKDRYRFIGLSLAEDGVAQYVSKNELKFQVYSGLSPETLKAYKLGSTPQTLVISPEGNVLQDWVGAYAGDQKSQVEAFFRVKLPGLRELPKAETTKN